MSPLDSLIDWLLDGAPGTTAPELIARVGSDLRAHGIPVERLSAFVTTLHPSVGGRAFRWRQDAPVEVLDLPHGLSSEEYAIVEEAQCDRSGGYLVLPLVFTNGQRHVVTVSTRSPEDLSEEAIAALRSVIRPLARVVEILALRRTASNLLSTYVGRSSGDRILAGHIQKGDYETIRAVIWFSDLRGYTELSSRLPPREMIDTLNRVFECQVASIDKRGGEVLEFTGDGILAIFALDEAGANTRHLCDLALEAGDEAVSAVEDLPPSHGGPLRIGLALHVGELAYGNIGGANRLDFTAIGPAVNLAARLEGVTSKLRRGMVCSETFACLTTLPTQHLGLFELKGIVEPVHVFAPKLPRRHRAHGA